MKNSKRSLLLTVAFIAAALLIYLAWFIFSDFDAYSYNSRRVWTIIRVGALRSCIEQFKKAQNRNPESLSELKQFAKDQNEFDKNLFMEFISDPNGCDKETTVLDNSGGWYYNKETSQLKVNLTMPLNQYFKKCRYNKNEIPANW